MPDYPARVILGGGLRPSLSKDVSRSVNSSSLNYAARFSSIVRIISPGLNVRAISRSRGQLVNLSPLLNIQSLSKLYFNNGFSQDSSNVYLSKSALGLPIGLNLSLEAFFVACLAQWINRKEGTEQKIDVFLVGDGDKQSNYVYFSIQLTAKKSLTFVDEYEIQPTYAISPLDF
jgi:hypothetical protein